MFSWSESAWFSMMAGAALKGTVVLGAAWLAAFAMRGRSAAARHLVWTAAAAAVLAIPFLSAGLPALSLPAETWIAAEHRPGIPGPRHCPRGDRTALCSSRVHSGSSGHGRLAAQCGNAAAVDLDCRNRSRAASAGRRLHRALASEPEGGPLAAGRETLPVLEGPEGSMPMAFGFLRPVIFLPADAAGWTEERRRMVLLHEYAHIRRGDLATHLLARMALALHWWNPLSWTRLA